jgi:hypothetical protein
VTNPTKAELRRFTLLARDVGCLACRKDGRANFADIHHLVEGGRRRGHSESAPLCPWHHRGIKPDPSKSVILNEQMFGPSLARSKRAFVERYGTERELVKLADKLLAKVETNIVGRVA